MFRIFGVISLILLVCLSSGCSGERQTLNITPCPLSCEVKDGTFHWNEGTLIEVKGDVADRKIMMAAFEGSSFPVQFAETLLDNNVIVMQVVDKLPGINSPEGYVLEVGRESVSLKALSDAGLFYGIKTLLQLAEQGEGNIQASVVRDEPRFPYRGIMIDVSRHFRSKEFIKKQIALLSAFKINRLHLHLTDAAGWRLEIDKYPRLTEFAAWRKQETWKDWGANGQQYCEQSDPGASGGYYTKEDIREILEYARLHCVTVIPEIEMPSHSEEVLAAYPELSCSGKPYKHSDFCVGNDKTFEFLENVLSEVIDLFPSHYIHIGGDEAGKASWKTCSLCQARMKKEGLKDVDELQSYLIHRIERFLNSKGRSLLGWDEILDGGLAPNATVMSWRGEAGGIRAVKVGHRAVMTPGEYCYFDGYQDAPFSQPEAIGGYLPLSKVYEYNPVPDSLTASERSLIEGVQANVWAEYIVTDEHFEYMLYPRAFALAEVAWTQPDQKSWESFRTRVLDLIPKMKENGYDCFDFSKEIGNRREALQPIEHMAVGKKVQFNIPYWSGYPANGEKTLNDGLRGGWNYNDKRWLGFVKGNEMDVVVDLGTDTIIHSVAADFMQICGPYVYMPKQVVISVSSDNKEFTELKEINHEVVKDDAVSFKNFGWSGETSARYVRFQAFPADIAGAVLFTDEIVVK